MPSEKVNMMMQVNNTSRTHPARTVVLLFSAMLIVAGGFASGVVAQETKETQPQKPAATKRTYGGRDPFRKYEPLRPMKKDVLSNIPTIQERINQYKAQKAAAMNARMVAPKPTTALLLSEIQVIGI